MEVFDSPSHSYPSDAMWCHPRPKIRDDPGQQCSHRPGSVQLDKVPPAYQQVIEPGAIRKCDSVWNFTLSNQR
jgi:hypothetical protein